MLHLPPSFHLCEFDATTLQELIAKRAAVQNEVSTALRPFYCELCDKQFQNVAQYDEHTNSYAHHHKARFRDMQVVQRASLTTKEELDKRKEKERKREEKELRKLAKAAGIKLAKPPTSSKLGGDAAQPINSDREHQPCQDQGNWASAGPSSTPLAVPASEPSTSIRVNTAGWTSLGSTSDIPSRVPQQDDQHPSGSGNPGSTPAFRTGGWSSFETTSSIQRPTPPPVTTQQSPLPFPASFSAPALSTRGGWSNTPSMSSSSPSQPLLQEPSPDALAPLPSVPPPHQKPQKAAERQESARSGWQQFRSTGRRK